MRRRKDRRDRRLVLGAWALVVSDDELLRAQAGDGLGAAGLRCDEAACGRAALEMLESNERDYALVVLDEGLADLAAGEVEAIAAVTAPSADVVRCGLGDDRARAGPLWMEKPREASEFGRLVARLRARPRHAAVHA